MKLSIFWYIYYKHQVNIYGDIAIFKICPRTHLLKLPNLGRNLVKPMSKFIEPFMKIEFILPI